MTRVTHLITDLGIGGTEMVLYRLLSHMDRCRFDNQVVSLTTSGPVGDRIERLGVPVHTLAMRPGLPAPGALLRLVGMLRVRPPHVLQTWLYHADFVGLLAGKMTRPAVVWNVRCSGLNQRDYSRAFGWLLKVLAMTSPLPDAIVVNSRAGKLASETLGYRPRRWELIPNGFDLGTFRPNRAARRSKRQELGVSQETPLVGYVARFDPMKDHANFLRAAALLHRQRQDVHFALVGHGVDWSNAALARPIRDGGLQGHFHLLGERSDIAELTAALDVATCASYTEAFPNVLGEAMACGVPCVTTDVGDCAEVVGDTGVVVPPRDPVALANGWARILGMDQRERQELGLQAHERIRSSFDIAQMTRRYEALYESLADRAA